MEKFRVHHVKFYQLTPKAIFCLAYEEDSRKLAVVRSDFSIEIWDLSNIPYQEKIILGNSGHSVESIVWCNQRLFSAGLHSYITEYDLVRLIPKHHIPVSHGPTWCLGLNKQKTILAAGTENGYICLYAVVEEGLNFQKTLNKQEGRILCLAWHESGETIVTGSTDIIRIWNVESGRAVDRIIVDRIEQKTEAIVWCIAITRDFVIISGDSLGRTSFWDGKTATLINAIKFHKADVLTLCLSKDENSVYVGSVDPVIIQFTRVSSQTAESSSQKQRKEWMKSIQRIVHTHDVRALQIAGEFLVSGGCDTYLVLSKFPPKVRLRYSPFPQRSCCHVGDKDNSLLLQYPQSLDLWRLGSTKVTSGNDRQILPFSTNPIKTLQLKCKEKEQIICSAISDDAHWLAYSTVEELRLFHFVLESSVNTLSKPCLKKIEMPYGKCKAALCLKFSPYGSNLIVATKDGDVQVWKTSLSDPMLLHTFTGPSEGEERIHLLAISSTGHYVAAGDHRGHVIVYNIQKYEVHCSLPHYKCQPTCLAFDPVSEDLIVVYNDKKVVEYSVMKKAYSSWTRKHSMKNYFNIDHKFPITGITFHSNNSKLLILHDDSTIYAIDRIQTEDRKKKTRRESTSTNISNPAEVVENQCSEGMLVRTCKKYEHLITFQNLQDDFMVAVEIPSSCIMDTLPPPLRQKKYGT